MRQTVIDQHAPYFGFLGFLVPSICTSHVVFQVLIVLKTNKTRESVRFLEIMYCPRTEEITKKMTRKYVPGV